MSESFVDLAERLMSKGWDYPLVFGIMLSRTEQYLRGDISRAAFTAWFAQVQMVWEHYSTSQTFIPVGEEAMEAAIAATRAAAVAPEKAAAGPAGG